ncbi:MAG: hypothetical protein HKN72_05760 [Gemmatimonadetes bacterium]|nr:hypothetical protein [Gemmatimonadota bacterium]
MIHKLALSSLAIVALTGCYEQVLVPDDESDGRIEITNDEFELDQRVSYPESDVPINAPPAAEANGPAAAGPARAPASISLTLLAEAVPPIVAGQPVQATSVWLNSESKAVVSYNLRGSAALGALDYFIQLTKKTPKLLSTAVFLDTDINAVSMDGTFAYAAQASSDVALASPAVLERLRFLGNKFTLDGNLQAQLPSFAATSTVSTGSIIYATSGNAGSVVALDANDLSVLGEYALEDARWVAWDQAGGRIVVAQGTPGRLSVFEEGVFPGGSMNLIATHSFPGADVAESKSTVEIHGGKAFVAAGPEGVQIVCLDNGQIVGSVPRPDPASVGLDPSVVVTNSVTVQDDLMFISNGEAGVYAAAAEDSFETSACDDPQDVTVLGSLQFGLLQSVNHVVYRNEYLYVAAGLGGIKIVEVELN